MKKQILILLLLFGWIGHSCTGWIDLEPENNVTYTNYFKSEEDIANLARGIHYRIIQAEKNDHQEALGWIADSMRVASMTYQYRYAGIRRMETRYMSQASWSSHYSVIYHANFLLDNRHRAENITEERMEFYSQQAYFALGYAYFRIAQLWGEAPIIKSSLDIGQHGKVPVEQVLKEAETWALKALDLPEFKDLYDEKEKITNRQWACKGTAVALLAHLHAWRGALNNDMDDWAESEKYCTMLIENQVEDYQLEPNIETLTQRLGYNKGKGDLIASETIWENSYLVTADNNHFRQEENPYKVFLFYGFPHVLTMEFSAIPMLITKKTLVSDRMYTENDPRLAHFFHMEPDPATIPPVGWDDPDHDNYDPDWEPDPAKYVFGEDVPEIYCVDKWKADIWYRIPDNVNDPMYFVGMDVNRTVWRLADIYLLRAEVRARQGKFTAVDDLNEIRRRAGIDDYNAAVDGELQYAIFKERKRELVFEGQYYFDVIRNGYWKTELPAAYGRLTQEEVDMGALYLPVSGDAFTNNSAMTQNLYWSTRY